MRAESAGAAGPEGPGGTAGSHGPSGSAGAGGPSGANGAAGAGEPRREPGAGRGRRFQLTRDTARPEGGGRAAPGDAPAPARQWPLLAVMGVTGLGLLVVSFDAFRVGTLLIGLAMIGGAVLRWALPSVGMLAVRSRFTDMITYGGLGAAILLLSLMAQPHPWLKVPFLEDILHFTV
ncbi:DUF3017 domain-containing protein [Streptomyces roseoverticillatus]|uniref:DUF3017 domain-containing protein n=1 Tax=Streptomyces roseoverticillatus TaxID=66429 RepID=A0ABV3IVJ3_9ACTN